MSNPIINGAPVASSNEGAESHISATLDAIRSHGKQAQEAVPPAEPVQAKELDESKLIVEPPKDQPKEPPKAEKPPSDAIAKSFEKLAREKAAVRAEAEQMRQAKALQDKLGPQGMHKLLQAQQNGDVQGIIDALGVKPVARAEPTPSSEIAELRARLEAFESQAKQERTQQGRAKALSELVESTKESHPLVTEMGAHEQALKVVEDYINEHGELPAETREESFKIGLDYVEAQLAQQAEKWERVLTKRKTPASIAPVEAAAAPLAASNVGKTLSQTTSPAPVRPTDSPKSSEDYIAATIAAMKQHPNP